MFLSPFWTSEAIFFSVTESKVELRVPASHPSAPPLDRPSAAGQHQGAGVTSPLLRWKGFKSLPLRKAVMLQLDQAKDESIQLQVHLHTGLFPITQVNGIHIDQNYPIPTPCGHPKVSPPSLGKLSGAARHS